MVVGDEFDVTVKADDKAILGKPTVVIESGEEFVTVEGTKIKAVKPNEGEEIKIKITYRDNVWTQTFNVYNDITPEQYDTELYFSAHDGNFYDKDFNVVSIDGLFEGDKVVRAVNANGKTLQVVDGSVVGVDLGAQTTWADTVFTLYTVDKGLIINVKAADLIIDEAEDFDYFALDGTLTVSATAVTYDADDFVWDGYYVMVKDVDAKAYTFNSTRINPTTALWT